MGSSDVKFKIITVVNLIKKIYNNFSAGTPVDFSPWIFEDTLVRVNFRGVKYEFNCPTQSDSNVFLNPYYHEYDVPLLITTVLERGDTFIDVGAHCGLYTLIAGKIVGLQGHVVAVEPNPKNLALLRRNVLLNRLNNVFISSRAAGDKKTVMRFYYENGKTAFTSATKYASSSVMTETARLDDIARSQESIKLLKIDTEGLDLKVLKGAEETLAKTSYVVVEQTNEEVQEFLAKHGFNLYLLSASKNLVGAKSEICKPQILPVIGERIELDS